MGPISRPKHARGITRYNGACLDWFSHHGTHPNERKVTDGPVLAHDSVWCDVRGETDLRSSRKRHIGTDIGEVAHDRVVADVSARIDTHKIANTRPGLNGHE